MVKFSYNELVYAGETIETSIARVAEHGYDGIELSGEKPNDVDTDAVNDLLDEYGIEVSSLCGIYTEDRDLSTPADEKRENAIEYLQSCVDLAVAVDAGIVGVGPSPVGKIYPDADRETEWSLAVESIRQAADYAADAGVQLAIEPWNRYETYFINRLDQAGELARDVDRANVGVRCDLFHMNIEDPDPVAAIYEIGDDLIHVHGAGSTRAAPGRGHIHWNQVVRALKGIGYDDYVTFELLPAAADPFYILEDENADLTEFYDQFTREAIADLRHAWEVTD